MYQSANAREKLVYNSLKTKYVGLGNADTARNEFIDNMKRDTYASLIGHDSLVEHLSVSLNKPKGIIRHELIDKMAKPSS